MLKLARLIYLCKNAKQICNILFKFVRLKINNVNYCKIEFYTVIIAQAIDRS